MLRSNSQCITTVQMLSVDLGKAAVSVDSSGSIVEFEGYGVEIVVDEAAKIGVLRPILAQYVIGIFVGASLPRASRCAEVDGRAGRGSDGFMACEFAAAVPGQGSAHRWREAEQVFPQVGVTWWAWIPSGSAISVVNRLVC